MLRNVLSYPPHHFTITAHLSYRIHHELSLSLFHVIDVKPSKHLLISPHLPSYSVPFFLSAELQLLTGGVYL